jgi:hypothetical protein
VLADGDIGLEIGPHLADGFVGHGFGGDADFSESGEDFSDGFALDLQQDGVTRAGGVDVPDLEVAAGVTVTERRPPPAG